MKKYWIYICLLTSLICSISCHKDNEADNKCCDCLEKEGKSDAYAYPILPGTEEWKKLNSHAAMVEVCQIPENTLKNMCTFGLIETYYNYPLFFVVTAFNNTKEGMQLMFDEFNGAYELQNRADAPTKLMDKYIQLKPSDLDTTWTQIEQGRFLYQFAFMEFSLAYDPILQNLTKDQQSQLVSVAVNTYNEKMRISPSNWKTLTSFFIISNLLYQLHYEPFLTFVNKQPLMMGLINGNMINWKYLSEDEHLEIFGIVNTFLNEQK